MKISDTYKRYLEVCSKIESFNGRLTFSVADDRSSSEKITELSKLHAEYYALEAELRTYLKTFADMACELGVTRIDIKKAFGEHYEIKINSKEAKFRL